MTSFTLIPSTATLTIFILVFTRITATLSTLPVFGAAIVPVRYKVGMGILVSLLVMTSIRPDYTVVSLGGGYTVLALLSEVLLGMMLGVFVRFVLEAVSLGMSIVGFQMGFAVVNVVDPQSGGQVSLVGSFHSMLAGIIFIVSGLYRVFLLGLLDSFAIVAPGMAVMQASLGRFFYEAGGQLFRTAICVAAPIMVTLLITKIAMGIVARTVPQMNIFIVGFSLTIGLGLILMGLALPYVMQATVAAFERSAVTYHEFIRAVAQ